MKNKAYKNSQLKHKVFEAKRTGKKQVIWNISDSQAEFLQELGFRTEPFLYWIETRKWYNVQDKQGILKEIHFKCKQGNKKIVKKLNRKDIKLLDEFSVHYGVLKYRIVLNQETMNDAKKRLPKLGDRFLFL